MKKLLHLIILLIAFSFQACHQEDYEDNRLKSTKDIYQIPSDEEEIEINPKQLKLIKEIYYSDEWLQFDNKLKILAGEIHWELGYIINELPDEYYFPVYQDDESQVNAILMAYYNDEGILSLGQVPEIL